MVGVIVFVYKEELPWNVQMVPQSLATVNKPKSGDKDKTQNMQDKHANAQEAFRPAWNVVKSTKP